MKFQKVNNFNVSCYAIEIILMKSHKPKKIHRITKKINDFLVVKRLYKIKAKISIQWNANIADMMD